MAHKLNIVLFLPFLFFAGNSAAQEVTTYAQAVSEHQYTQEVLQKIRQVEQNVSFVKFSIKGKTNETLEQRMAYYKVKGVSIAVINNYQVEWAKGYGWADEASQQPVTAHTLFQPGSISKSLNALAVLKLVQAKKINLDADINTYLSSWKFPYDSLSKGKKITMAHLLSHTAGLSVHGFPGYYAGDPLPTVVQILNGEKPANTAPVRSLFEPGMQYQYSGGGTMITQLVQMDLTKQAYDEYIQKEILQPLGMSSSFYTQPPPADKNNIMATGYNAEGQEIKGKHTIMVEQAAAGLWTTPSDLCKFIIEMQLSAKGKSNKILSKELTKKMLTPYKNPSSGLGVFVQDMGGARYFSHTAGNLGFSGVYYGSLEEGTGVVVFINSDGGVEIMDEVLTSVANVYQWKGIYSREKPVVKEPVDVPDAVKDQYIGQYRENGMVVSISKQNNELWYQAAGRPMQMYFTSTSAFFNLESKTEKEFYFDASGQVKGFVRTLNGKTLGKAEKVLLFLLPDDLLKKYAGRYGDAAMGHVQIAIKDQELWMDADGTSKKLVFNSETEFVTLEDPGIIFSFVLDDTQKVTGIKAKMGADEMVIKRAD